MIKSVTPRVRIDFERTLVRRRLEDVLDRIRVFRRFWWDRSDVDAICNQETRQEINVKKQEGSINYDLPRIETKTESTD